MWVGFRLLKGDMASADIADAVVKDKPRKRGYHRTPQGSFTTLDKDCGIDHKGRDKRDPINPLDDDEKELNRPTGARG